MKVIVFLLALVLLATASPVPEEASALTRCQDEYNRIVARLMGMGAMNTAWKLFFNYLDLDGNEIITGSEIAVRFYDNGILGEENMIQAANEAETWIAAKQGNVAEAQHFEILKKDFEVRMQRAIGGRVSHDQVESQKVTTNICSLFVHMLPRIKWNMEELLNCAVDVQKDEMKVFHELTSRTTEPQVTQGAINTWEAVFNTIDKNRDQVLDVQELKDATKLPMSQESDTLLNTAFAKLIGDTTDHSYSISWNLFIKLISKVVLAKGPLTPWEGVETVEELEGRQYFCHGAKNINRDVIKQRQYNFDCIRVYDNVSESVLGFDKLYANVIIFTIVDTNRDGMISTKELVAFTGQESPLFPPMDELGYDVEYFTHYTPDHLKTVADAADSNNATKVSELSRMAVDELIAEEQLCTGMINVLKKFPHPQNPQYGFLEREEISSNVDEEEKEEEEKYEAEWEEFEGLKKSINLNAEFMEPQDIFAAPTEFPVEETESPIKEEEEVTTQQPIEETTEKQTTTEASLEDLFHSLLSETNPEHPPKSVTNNPEEDHFAMDLKTMIKDEDEFAPEKSSDQKQLTAILEKMDTEEQAGGVHEEEEEEEGEEHSYLLTDSEEAALRALIEDVFNKGREKEEPNIQK